MQYRVVYDQSEDSGSSDDEDSFLDRLFKNSNAMYGKKEIGGAGGRVGSGFGGGDAAEGG